MSRAFLLAGLAFGDEGKGSCVDAIVRQEGARLVVRYNGGAQAAHNVVLPDGTHHTFSQFGSGALAGASTHLSRFMMVNPATMLNEAAHLGAIGIKDPLSLVTIEREALVTTPFHMAMNRLRELARGDKRHGSCGMGIGETMAYALAHPPDAIRFGDLGDFVTLHRKIQILQDRLYEEVRACVGLLDPFRQTDAFAPFLLLATKSQDSMVDMLAPMRKVASSVTAVGRDWLPKAMQNVVTIFEGAQGVLLDETYGFQPYTTWSDCTFGNANELLADFSGEVTRLGVTRAFMTRHGPGPFPTEDPELAPLVAHDHNTTGPWQGSFRVGWLDLDLLRFAVRIIGGLDGLCVTNIDRLALLQPTPTPPARVIADELDVPLWMQSIGPTHVEKSWVRP